MSAADLIRTLDKHLAPLGALRARAMFGGHGLYLDDLMFGLIAFDKLWLKTDAETRPAFEKARSEPFTYHSGERTIIMSYWLCPPQVLEDARKLRDWAVKARAAAQRAKATKPRRKKRATFAR